jgi:hypothetical protein
MVIDMHNAVIGGGPGPGPLPDTRSTWTRMFCDVCGGRFEEMIPG